MAERIFQNIGRQPRSVWDPLHRWNVSNMRVVKGCLRLVRFLELTIRLANQFGAGQSLHVATEVLDFLMSDPVLKHRCPANSGRFVVPAKLAAARMIVYLSRIFPNYLRNYMTYYGSVVARMRQSSVQDGAHTKEAHGHPLEFWQGMFLDLTDPPLQFFVCAVSGVFSFIHAPLGLAVQTVSMTVFEKSAMVHQTFDRCRKLRALLKRLLGIVDIFLWVEPYLSRTADAKLPSEAELEALRLEGIPPPPPAHKSWKLAFHIMLTHTRWLDIRLNMADAHAHLLTKAKFDCARPRPRPAAAVSSTSSSSSTVPDSASSSGSTSDSDTSVGSTSDADSESTPSAAPTMESPHCHACAPDLPRACSRIAACHL